MKKTILRTNGYKVIDDNEKGYIHIEPIPSDSELEQVYAEEYYGVEKSQYIEHTQEDIEWWETSFKDRFDIFEKYCKTSKKILDIGCGSGYFLNYGQQREWECYGIEPSKLSSKHAKEMGLNVLTGVFKDGVYEQSSFDVVHMQDVLEHINHPEKFLENVYKILKENGVLCIGVPNDFSPLQKILWENLGFKPWWVTAPTHINYFNPDSLKKLLTKLGFEIALEESTFPMEFFLLMGDDYISEPTLGRKMHAKRKQFDITLSQYDNDLKRKLYQSLAALNLGREIIVYAKKRQ